MLSIRAQCSFLNFPTLQVHSTGGMWRIGRPIRNMFPYWHAYPPHSTIFHLWNVPEICFHLIIFKKQPVPVWKFYRKTEVNFSPSTAVLLSHEYETSIDKILIFYSVAIVLFKNLCIPISGTFHRWRMVLCGG